MSGVAVYTGPFGKEQAERLLWRAGFGPRQGDADALAKLGLAGRRPVADAPGPARAARRAAAGRPSTGAADRPGQRLRRRPPLVARPDDPHDDAADRADDADLAFLVRDLEPGVGQQQLMLNQNQLFRTNALGSFATMLTGVTDRPGDARLAERRPERQGEPERELRARDDGALHARRRPRRLHPVRRARQRARAHRLVGLGHEGRRLGLHLRREPPRRDEQDDLRPHGRLELAGLLQPLPQPPAPPVLLRQQALGLLRPDAARQRHLGRAAGALREPRDPAGRRGDPDAPRLLHRPAHGQAARRLQRRPAAHAGRVHQQLDLVVARPVRRPAALLPARRRRLGLHALAEHGDVPGALVHGGARAGHGHAGLVAERSRRSSSSG